jgi:hypothetical protein
MMRFTVIDAHGTVSFSGPGHCLKALVAACSYGPVELEDLLQRVRQIDGRFVEHVLNELARFDEHVVPEHPESIDRWLEQSGESTCEAFRVFDQRLRNRSLTAERLGVVLFNLPEHRIVQIENSYGELLRQDRGRIRVNGKPVNRYYHYSLPENWSLLP